MFETLKSDIQAVMDRDPAARSKAEVFFLYSGFKAVRSHRKAHWFFNHNHKFIARWISQRSRRHPTLGNNVLVGSGAKVLGPFTVGDNARIAAGAVVLREVPPNATAVGVPARIVRLNGIRHENLDQIHVDDPVARDLGELEHQLSELSEQLEKLHAESNRRVYPAESSFDSASL